ncbi:hypothetical protein chiPu_0032078, partial [Chiloscyllium punctatum]|nr:hypothetical protein [Chiloscyllium punctatum]
MARHRVGQQQRQHGRQRIAEQQQVDETAADVLPPQHRVLQPQQPEQTGKPGEDGEQHRGDIVHDAAAAQPQPLQPDRHRERHADLQRDLGQSRAGVIDVAAIDRVADLHEGEQHREQDRRRLDHPQRHVVAVAAQEMTAGPERQRRNAIAPQQPVEDRRGADGIAGDPRLVADAQHDDGGEDRGKPAQEPDR